MKYKEIDIEDAWVLYQVGAPVERLMNEEDGWQLVVDRFGREPANEHKDVFMDCYSDCNVTFRVLIDE